MKGILRVLSAIGVVGAVASLGATGSSGAGAISGSIMSGLNPLFANYTVTCDESRIGSCREAAWFRAPHRDRSEAL